MIGVNKSFMPNKTTTNAKIPTIVLEIGERRVVACLLKERRVFIGFDSKDDW